MCEKFKTTLPLFEGGELANILNMPDLIAEIVEAQLKEKEHIILQACIQKQQKEIEKLKKELRKYKNY